MSTVFDPDVLHQMCQKVVGQPLEQMVANLKAELAARHPGHVATATDWIFSLYGGTTGVLMLLHGSITEYLIFYGSAIDTSGFSGRFLMEVHDYVLSGEMRCFTEDRCTESQLYRPGSHAVLPRGHAKGFSIAPDTWMLEYGRGFIPACLPFGLSGAFANLDAPTLAKTVCGFGRLVTGELLKGKI
jgi:C-8 sterol isomerase